MANLREAGEALRRRASSPNTVRVYESDQKIFARWCQSVGRSALPAAPETLDLYLVHLIEGVRRKLSGVERVAHAIAWAHQKAGLPSPLSESARQILAGARRVYPQTTEQKQPLSIAQLRQISAGFDVRTVLGARDRAILVIGFAGGFRRSELAALDLRDVEITSDGLCIHVRRSKTDQQARGRVVTLPRGTRQITCPVRSLQAWLKHRGKTPGPLLQTLSPADHATQLGRMRGQQVARVVKSAVAKIGLDPAEYSGHSLRSGLVTAALEAGTPESIIMRRTGHRRVETLAQYARPSASYDPLRRAL